MGARASQCVGVGCGGPTSPNHQGVRDEKFRHKSHDYSHPTLTEQLSLHGIRQFELDVHLSKEGEFEVFHLQKIDARTSCATLAACLEECLAWSIAHGVCPFSKM